MTYEAYSPNDTTFYTIANPGHFLSSCLITRKNMGKSTLIVESYPSFNANHKKDKKQTKTRSAAKLAKIAKFNAQDKANLKAQRRLVQKTIDKSRDRKRKLKATEAGFRTPMEEDDARNEADCVDFTIGMEKYEAAVWNKKSKGYLTTGK